MYKGCAAVHSAWPRFLMGGEKGEGPATCWQLLATFSVERVRDWRRWMAEILDFGDVKEGGGYK